MGTLPWAEVHVLCDLSTRVSILDGQTDAEYACLGP